MIFAYIAYLPGSVASVMATCAWWRTILLSLPFMLPSIQALVNTSTDDRRAIPFDTLAAYITEDVAQPAPYGSFWNLHFVDRFLNGRLGRTFYDRTFSVDIPAAFNANALTWLKLRFDDTFEQAYNYVCAFTLGLTNNLKLLEISFARKIPTAHSSMSQGLDVTKFKKWFALRPATGRERLAHLRRITLVNAPAVWRTAIFSMTRLDTLVYAGDVDQPLLLALAQKNARKLALRIDHFRPSFTTSLPACDFPRLRKLRLEGCYEIIHSMLTIIRGARDLDKLAVTDIRGSGLGNRLHAFLKRNLCMPRSLNICFPHTTALSHVADSIPTRSESYNTSLNDLSTYLSRLTSLSLGEMHVSAVLLQLIGDSPAVARRHACLANVSILKLSYVTRAAASQLMHMVRKRDSLHVYRPFKLVEIVHAVDSVPALEFFMQPQYTEKFIYLYPCTSDAPTSSHLAASGNRSAGPVSTSN